MAWRLAKSLQALRAQLDAAHPQRSKRSDGTIGDEDHQTRESDHNPWVKDGSMGVVTAMDITHDPKHGVDAGRLAEMANLDRRCKYVIYNHRIESSDRDESWEPYGGANPHVSHVHISVHSDPARYDDDTAWRLPGARSAQAVKPTWEQLWEHVSRRFPTLRLTSSYRPAESKSWHGMSGGRAIDVAGPQPDPDGNALTVEVTRWCATVWPNLTELIHTPAGPEWQLKNGHRHRYSQPTQDEHHNHIHIAYDIDVVPAPKPTPIKENDMPYTTWPQKDRDQLLKDIELTLGRFDGGVFNQPGKRETLRHVITRVSRIEDTLRHVITRLARIEDTLGDVKSLIRTGHDDLGELAMKIVQLIDERLAGTTVEHPGELVGAGAPE